MSGEEPLFRFGLLADIQYGEVPDKGRKCFREALGRTQRAVALLDGEGMGDLCFVAHLGDVIEGQASAEGTSRDLAAVLSALEQLHRPPQRPLFHVLGNHCLRHPRPELVPLLRLSSPSSTADPPSSNAYYSVPSPHPGWRVLVLDGLEVSVEHWQLALPPDSPLITPNFRLAQERSLIFTQFSISP